MAGGGTISTSETKIEALSLQSSAYGVTVSKGYGVYKTSGNLLDYQNFKAIPHTTTESAGGKGGSGPQMQNTKYTYSASVLMAIGHGANITAISKIWRGKAKYPALSDLGMSLFSGALGQSPWSAMTSINATHSLGYSGMAYVAAQDYDLGDDASVENHVFEVVDQFAFSLGAEIPDVDPSDVIGDLLPNARYGAGFTASLDLAQYSNYCRATGLLISPVLTEQTQAASVLADLARLTNTGIVWSNNVLRMVPFGEVEATGNGRTFTPINTVRYNLTDAHFCNTDEPVGQERTSGGDRYNHWRVEFKNRANEYAVEIAEDKDETDIDANGHRPADVLQAHWICDAAVAQKVASLLLQRSLYIVNKWTFELPWHFCRLEPMDIVSLTDPAQGLFETPVRIIEKVESGDQLVFTAEDYLSGVSTLPGYTMQTGQGGSPVDFNALPGDVTQPMFIEAPVELSSTGLEVLVAVSGQVTDWGGCRVWVSNDGTNYKQLTTIYGGARYGTLTASLSSAPAGTLSVQLTGLGGQLLSGSALDSETLTTLCWVKAAGGHAEFLAYQTATLISGNQYTLTGLTRGGYGSDQGAKASTSKFARIDDAVVRSGPLQLDMIGRTLHFKFASFNTLGGAQQTLDECTEYTYVVTGEMVHLPPAAITAITPQSKVFGIDLSWVLPALASNLRNTEIWSSATNDRATATKLGDFAYPQATHTITGLASGAQRYFWARLVDQFENVGAWYPASATAGVSGTASSSATEILDYLSGQITSTQLSTALNTSIGASAVAVEAISDSLASMYTIKTSLTVGGRLYLAGLGVGVENTSGVVESQVLVSADKFAIINPTSETLTSPFVVTGGNTYINQAFIGIGWITNAMIGNVIQSDDFVTGTTGWRIKKDGGIECRNIVARGDIEATSLSAATGTFSGELSAATGTFSGTLTAFAVNAVNTINIANNAITIPVGIQILNDTIQDTGSIDWGGGAVIIVATAESANGANAAKAGVKVLRDGVPLFTAYGTQTYSSPSSASRVWVDNPGPGSHVYTLYPLNTGSSNVTCAAFIGAKK